MCVTMITWSACGCVHGNLRSHHCYWSDHEEHIIVLAGWLGWQLCHWNDHSCTHILLVWWVHLHVPWHVVWNGYGCDRTHSNTLLVGGCLVGAPSLTVNYTRGGRPARPLLASVNVRLSSGAIKFPAALCWGSRPRPRVRRRYFVIDRVAIILLVYKEHKHLFAFCILTTTI